MASSNLLLLKLAAGLASPEELNVLDNTLVITGGGLVTSPPPRSVENWQQRCVAKGAKPSGDADGVVSDLSPVVPPDAAPTFTTTRDGLILCKPENEPKPEGKKSYVPDNAADGRRRVTRWNGSRWVTRRV